jgi:hypothetical protein
MHRAFALALALLSPSWNLYAFAQQTQPTPNSASQQQQGGAVPLSNRDVMQMLKQGISAEVVIAKISSPSALQELKKEQVPDEVLLAMVKAGMSTPADAAAAHDGAGQQEIGIKDGTPITIQLASNLTSSTAKEGDLVSFIVVEPVIVEGVTLIPSGAPVTARVVAVKKAGHWGRAGKLSVALQHVVAADGSRVPLRMSKKVVGDSKGASVATATIVTGIIFLPAAPIWGLKRGKEAVFPAGKQFEAFVHGEAKVSVRGASGRADAR